MTGDFKQNIEDDYHLKVGGILYKLAIAEDFTADVSSGGPLLFAHKELTPETSGFNESTKYGEQHS